MIVATAVSFAAYFGAFGPTLKATSAFLALGVALVLPPLVAWATRGKYYIARASELPDGAELSCVRCHGTYDRIDMAGCPHHEGLICSLCCSTDGGCHDSCKAPGTADRIHLGMPAGLAASSLDVTVEEEVA
jgi:hypothetical protein